MNIVTYDTRILKEEKEDFNRFLRNEYSFEGFELIGSSRSLYLKVQFHNMEEACIFNGCSDPEFYYRNRLRSKK